MTERLRMWIVRESGFPFGVPSNEVGQVEAVDRDAAGQLALRIWGRLMVIDPKPVERVES